MFNTVFRDICATNACGKYGRNHMCPPDIGDINELIDKAESFDKVLVYQTITELEDSFDIEGMESAAVLHNKLAHLLRVEMDKLPLVTLNLAAGGCQMCKVCAKIDNKPCRHPDEAMSSLEAHGISVSDLAASCGMKYINGKAQELKSCITNALASLLNDSAAKTQIDVKDIDYVVITGNTAMLYLLIGRDVKCLSAAPFEADCLFG